MRHIVTINFSRRYGVMGIYRDRAGRAWHVYPMPFVRITLGGTS